MLSSMGKRGPKPENTERAVTYLSPDDSAWLDDEAVRRDSDRSAVLREALVRLRKAEERKRSKK